MDEHRNSDTDRAVDPTDETFGAVYMEPIELPQYGDEPSETLFPTRKKKRASDGHGKGNGKSRKRKKRLRKSALALICAAVVVIIGTVVTLAVVNQRRVAAEIAAQVAAEEALRLQQEQERAEFEALASSTVFLNNIVVEGVPIGGMTMDEANAALQDAAKTVGARGELQLFYKNSIYSLDLSEIAFSTNLVTVLNEAYALGKTGDYQTMKAEVESVQTNGRSYRLHVVHDLSEASRLSAQIAAALDTSAQNAAVKAVNTETRTIEFNDEVVGISVDQAALTEIIENAVEQNNMTSRDIPVTETLPTITRAELESLYVLRGTATTDFSSSPSARKFNVRKGAGMISGTVLKPGETFSTNDVLGVRNRSNGWKEANAYESGAVVPQYGGGVCQLSSTLYNAISKADLEVVSRRNHSMPVSYVKEGLDATINSVGNIIDFQFKNNTQGDVVIFGFTTENNRVTFEIWGMPFATDEYDEIRLSSKRVGTTEPAGEPVELTVAVGTEKADGSLMVAGETYTAVTPRKGYTYQSYKEYYKAGALVRSEKYAVSTYKAYQGEIWHCIDPNATETGGTGEIGTNEPDTGGTESTGGSTGEIVFGG